MIGSLPLRAVSVSRRPGNVSRSGNDGACWFVVLLTSQRRFYAQGFYNLGVFCELQSSNALYV